jgi:hypothetical protein
MTSNKDNKDTINRRRSDNIPTCSKDSNLESEDSNESTEDSVEVKGFSVKFKGMYTTTLIVLALVVMVWILQACTNTSTYTMHSTQIQNIDTNGTSSSPETKIETNSTTKSVNQIKLL